jgi:class 3 adenylate cyclase
MLDDAHIDAGAAAYRGFLFSDLRGFTAFAERYGNTAAAAKVSRFLEIARRAIARFEGAEIKTEGDAIHAVFPSASSAVMCGLEIVDAADELNAEEPDRPLNLGVGVHAGEAVETAEGYIGSAVNLAARLCAVALPGEVLVTSTVKGITQASIPVGFIARGRRRLKGIREPVEVYAVTRDMTASASRAASNNVVLAVAAVSLAAVVAIAAILTPQFLTSPGASPSPTAAPAVQPLAIGPLPIGTYASAEFQPPVSFKILDTDWSANRDDADVLALIRDATPRGTVTFLRVRTVFTNPCVAEGEGAQTGPAASDLFAALAGIGHLTLSTPQPVQVGGYTGQQVEINVAQEALSACGGLAGAEVPLFGAGEEVWSAASAERFRLISVDVGGPTVTILLSADYTQTPSTQELENMWELGQRVVGSVGF